MTANLYCSVADLYLYGLPRGSLDEPARSIAAVDASANTLRVSAHGFAADDRVRVVAQANGVLPSPLAASTTYYARVVDAETLQLSLSAGGAAIDLTDAGTLPCGIYGVLDATAEAAIEYVSRLIDQSLPAHVAPQDPGDVPVLLRGIAAKLAARELLARIGRQNELMSATADRATEELRQLRSGMLSVRDPAASALANCSAGWGGSERGWGTSSSEGGTLP